MQSLAPVGTWELDLSADNQIKAWFKNGQIEDILFGITYSGRTPEWPGWDATGDSSFGKKEHAIARVPTLLG
jgi:hypothetical protein